MARQSGSTPRRRSTKGRDSTGHLQLNDDAAEKESNRRNSSHTNARRASLATVARETLKVNQSREEGGGAPILANFEQWMKLVKDNKINANNSWNFALIDYFHDMSVLKEGDGINFQKASYTLDGCVKIYTSRVDSIATETGKLLSGLADSKSKEMDDGEDGQNDDEDSDGEGQAAKQKARKRKKHAESTLAASFEQLQNKKMDLESAIDPLFRKMCADFDEGGAKGLLLNSLTIDKDGRVVFDGEADYDSDDENANDEEEDDDEDDGDEGREKAKTSKTTGDPEDIDIEALKTEFLYDDLEDLEVVPSMSSLTNALTDPALLGDSIIKEIEGMDTSMQKSTDVDVFGEDDLGDIGDLGGFDGMDLEDGLTFGEPNTSRVVNDTSGYVGSYALNASIVGAHEKDIMSYFDETLKRNWAGPEHWKVQKLKASSLLVNDEPTKKRIKPKEKEQFFIDFMSDDAELDESKLFAEGTATMNLPKAQWKSKTRNLLPDDRHFSSKNLIKLFIKPKGNILNFGIFSESRAAEVNEDEVNADEHFWAGQYQKQQQEDPTGNYDANFFNDDGPSAIGGNGGGAGDDDVGGDYDYDYGNDDYGPPASPLAGHERDPTAIEDQLLQASRRARPEYVNYARTAKRVNVKLLKDNIWKTMQLRDDQNLKAEAPDSGAKSGESEPVVKEESEERKFTQVVQDLQSAYSSQQMSEISTSFCFICVLHLANENGLVLEGNEDYSDLTIKRDPDAPPIGETAIA